jgi:hypothetical protein
MACFDLGKLLCSLGRFYQSKFFFGREKNSFESPRIVEIVFQTKNLVKTV